MKADRKDTTEFLGEIAASLSHELQNVLAIIRENAGLLEDIQSMTGDDSPMAGPLLKCLEVIGRQVDRGVGLTMGLNRFAHTTDHPVVSVNLHAVLTNLVVVSSRLFQKKGGRLVVEHSDDEPSVTVDPVLFQQAVYQGLHCLFAHLPDKSEISISVGNADKGARVRFASKAPACDAVSADITEAEGAAWSAVQALADRLGATLVVDLSVPGFDLRFSERSD